MMVRILRLGTSDDQNPAIPESERVGSVCEQAFSKEIGLPVETVFRRIVPNPDAPGVIERWLTRYEPECVVLVISSVWCSYETAAYRMQTSWPALLQPAGRAVQKWGGRTAASNALALRAGRMLARRFVGVSALFRPGDVVATTEACIRAILRREDVVLIVRGPVTRYPGDRGDVTRARLETTRLQVDQGLALICERLHVDYISRAPDAPGRDDRILLPDGVHCNAVEHRRRGLREGATLAAAWRRLTMRDEVTTVR